MYSFSILLWEILTLDKAFGRMSVDEHRDRVVKGNDRPDLDPGWSRSLQDLLDCCWKRNPFQRPSAREVYKLLKQEIQSTMVETFPKQAQAEEDRRRKDR